MYMSRCKSVYLEFVILNKCCAQCGARRLLKWFCFLNNCLIRVSLSLIKDIFTNITFTGSAMVNWNRRLLIQVVTAVIVVIVRALGHFVG